MYWFSVIKRLPYIRVVKHTVRGPDVARAPLKCGPQSVAIIVTTLNNTSKCCSYFKFNKSLTFNYTFWEIAASTFIRMKKSGPLLIWVRPPCRILIKKDFQWQNIVGIKQFGSCILHKYVFLLCYGEMHCVSILFKLVKIKNSV